MLRRISMYRIVFLDIDGTILNSQEQLDEQLIETVRKIKQKGVHVALATGRSLDGAIPYGEKLGTSTYVTYNGGYVLSEGSVIHDVKIPSSLAHNLCKKTHELNGVFIHFSDRTSRSNHPLRGIEYLLPEAVESNIIDTKQEAHRLALYIQAEHRAALQEMITGAADFDEGDRLEVFPAGSKWTGILPLINQLGITQNEVVTIGNGTNDIEMLEAAGLGVAMNNAPESVKKSADWVTEDNDHQGVMLALRKIFNLHP
ncbi:hypothetical protein C4B60_17865 [Jeotgalibacillus proteolyticus]|uniref:Cof-type HAD-IIB family hydrolase n=2 Tax=Jeotgalibacillus proteolyticus TaxID=2082395 RepID=A0A2S5G858_9BACL|nr:hypothetical protein C4B60_17865 [Jeotgalibacillus proteolyticus]